MVVVIRCKCVVVVVVVMVCAVVVLCLCLVAVLSQLLCTNVLLFINLFCGLFPLTSLNVNTHANFNFSSSLREITRRGPGGPKTPQLDIEKISNRAQHPEKVFSQSVLCHDHSQAAIIREQDRISYLLKAMISTIPRHHRGTCGNSYGRSTWVKQQSRFSSA